MTERTKSEVSIQSVGFGPVLPDNLDLTKLRKPLEYTISKLEPEGGPPASEYLFNCIAMVIYCEKHRKIALSFNERSDATWLPFIVAPPYKTWNDATKDGIQVIFSKEDAELDARLTTTVPIQSMHCVHILRFQVPITQKFVYRLIQLVKLCESKDFRCCQNSNKHRIKWISLDDASTGAVSKLWGPEVVIFATFVNELRQQEIYEFGLEQVYNFVPKEGCPKSAEEEMMRANEIGHLETEKVYGDFLEHCFPSFFMTYASFFSYMNSLLPEFNFKNFETIAVQMFHSMNFHRNGYISFYEFLLGLVSMEPKTPNNRARLKLIFRYYDIDQDNILNSAEINQMLAEINIDPNIVRNQLEAYNNCLNFSNFQVLIQKGDLFNCDLLCRFPFSVVTRICQNFTKRREQRLLATKRAVIKLNKQTNNVDLCLGCREKKYQFGTHLVKLDSNGRCVEPRQLPDSKFS